MNAEFRIIGKPQRRLDAFDKVTGRMKYTSDYSLPGMLHLKALRSPYPHARIVSIDAQRARALPGVRLVLTQKDFASVTWIPPQPAMSDVARFVGDEIAIVAAKDEETAIEALALIEVKYQPLAFVIDPEEALKPNAPKIFPQGNLIGGKPVVLSRGSIEKGFAEADLVYEARYSTPYLQHATAETRVSVAHWDAGKLTLWESTQGPFELQRAIAKALKIPVSKVRVICEATGGGFGDKGSPGRQAIYASTVARLTGQPAKMELERDENYLAATHRFPVICNLKYGVKKDGTLTAIQAKVTADSGAYSIAGQAALSSLECMASVYRCANMRGEAITAITNNPPTGPMRCVGHPQGTFAQEVHMDVIAEKLGMDPVEFRRKNHVHLEDGDQFRKIPFTSNGLAECITRGSDALQWGQRWARKPQTSGPVKRGLGMALHGCRHGSMLPVMALSGLVKVNVDGTVNVYTGATELGSGQRTTMGIIAAEVLGVLMDDVYVTAADTDMTTDTGTTTGSRQTNTGGNGVRLAALDARNQLLDIAATELKADKKSISIRDGKVFVGSSEKGVPLEDIASKAPGGVIVGRGVMRPPSDVFSHAFAAHFAEVSVDTRTGTVRVERLVAVHDLGRTINLLGAENQIQGGAIQGTAFCLSERQRFDTPTGICVNPDHLNYKLPTIKDAAPVEPMMVESIDAVGPFGAKGVGEPPYSGASPAIANAIYNAIGIRFTELPITNREVLARLQAGQGQRGEKR